MSQTLLKSIRFPAAILLALALALLLTLSAQAQDEPPPPEAPAAPAAVPAGAEFSGDGADEPVDTAPPPLAGTHLQTYSGPDPWFYCSGAEPGGDPFPGNGKCEYVGNALTTAINEFAFRGGSGVITCEDGVYSTSPFINAVPMLTGIVSENGSGATSITGRVEITGQTSGFILRGFAIGTGVNSTTPLLWMYGNSGAIKLTDITLNDNGTGPGLHIDNHAGSVTLERVQVDNNASIAGSNYIARITTNPTTTGNITINNSSFDDNLSPAVDAGITLILYSNAGKISMNGVSVSNNNVGDGMMVFATKGITIKNSQINHNGDGVANAFGNGINMLVDTTGSLLFENITVNNNENVGLRLRIHGAVTIRNAGIQLNGSSGIEVDNCYFDGIACNPGGSYGVSIYNADLLDNAGTGLYIQSNGSVLLDGVRSNDSFTMGAVIYSHFATSAKPVTILRSEFNETVNGTGLSILTRGKVTLKSVNASGSLTGSGVIIDNRYGSAGIEILGTYGLNDFSTNHGTGLTIMSDGSVSLRDVNASSNFNSGIDLSIGFSLNVSLVNVGASLNGTSGFGVGIDVLTRGTISARDVSGWANVNEEAILLDNTIAAPTSYPGVSVTGANVGNSRAGLVVYSRGAVTLVDIYSAGNTGPNGGVLVDNCRGMPCIGKGNVTLREIEVEQNTGGLGVFIQSGGIVSLTNAYSHTNQLDSLRILNTQAVGTPGIIIKSGYFSTSSTGSGADLETKGSIQLVNVAATGNANYGMFVYVDGNKPVSMSTTGGGRNIFYSNGYYGLIVQTTGAINVRGVTSSNPAGYDGIYLANNGLGATAGITVRDVEVYDNHYRGLVVRTHGTISAAGIVAYENDTASASFQYAVMLDNCDYSGGVCAYTGSARPVSLAAYGSIENAIYSNGKSGLSITTLGAITVSKTSASSNPGTGGYGALLDASSGVGTVTVSKSNFNGNGNTGLRILAPGNITLTDVDAGKNSGGVVYGIWINTSGNLSMTRVLASGNANSNINAVVNGGTVTLRDVEANESALGYGININNSSSTVKPVYLYRVTATGNQGDNIRIVSQGAITASGVTAVDSVLGSGLYLKNTAGTAGITFNTTYGANTANGNALNGLWLDTYGDITISGLTASENHAVGIENSGAGATAAAAAVIKLTSVRVEGNWSDGINMTTNTTSMRITSSIVMGNSLNGIDVTLGAGFGNQLIVKSSFFYGNDRIGGGFSNIQVTNGIVVIQ